MLMTKLEEPFGHRTLPHTADVAIEAWAPNRAGCYAEAVRALIDTFADTSQVVVTESAPLRIEPASDEELLVALLEEVIFLLDVLGMLPAGVVVEEAVDGGLGGMLDLAPVNGAALVGAVPKAVSRAGLAFGFDGELWTCRATIDV
jgi:SHS2 domain-containing protein